jgi:hypothetical protein
MNATPLLQRIRLPHPREFFYWQLDFSHQLIVKKTLGWPRSPIAAPFISSNENSSLVEDQARI